MRQCNNISNNLRQYVFGQFGSWTTFWSFEVVNRFYPQGECGAQFSYGPQPCTRPVFCVVCELWSIPIPRNGALRQWFIVATISGKFFLLKSLLAGTTTVMHMYGPNDTYPCVFNMKRTTYPYLLDDFYDASQFEMINFANVNIEHSNSDPVISLFGNMQIMFKFMEYDVTCIN